MSKITWDGTGDRLFEMGVSQGVLYLQKNTDTNNKPYNAGVAWNGLISVTENPEGAEATDLWADDIKYATLRSAETFGATIEAYTYPDEFASCDGSAEPLTGVRFGQQNRDVFGLCYKTKVGSDSDASASNRYKLHLIYGATAAPSEKAYQTINDSPDAITFSWEIQTTPVNATGINNVDYKPVSSIVIDSALVNAAKLTALENILYGTNGSGNTAGTEPRLPLPDEVVSTLTPPSNG